MRFTRIEGRPPKRPQRVAPPEPPPAEAAAHGPAARPDRPRVRPSAYLLVSLLFSVLVFSFFLVGDNGFLAVHAKRRELTALQGEVSALALENQRLEEEVAALKDDPKAVERIAREDLNMARRGEIVLVLPPGWKSRVTPGASRAAPQPSPSPATASAPTPGPSSAEAPAEGPPAPR